MVREDRLRHFLNVRIEVDRIHDFDVAPLGQRQKPRATRSRPPSKLSRRWPVVNQALAGIELRQQAIEGGGAFRFGVGDRDRVEQGVDHCIAGHDQPRRVDAFAQQVLARSGRRKMPDPRSR